MSRHKYVLHPQTRVKEFEGTEDRLSLGTARNDGTRVEVPDVGEGQEMFSTRSSAEPQMSSNETRVIYNGLKRLPGRGRDRGLGKRGGIGV